MNRYLANIQKRGVGKKWVDKKGEWDCVIRSLFINVDGMSVDDDLGLAARLVRYFRKEGARHLQFTHELRQQFSDPLCGFVDCFSMRDLYLGEYTGELVRVPTEHFMLDPLAERLPGQCRVIEVQIVGEEQAYLVDV